MKSLDQIIMYLQTQEHCEFRLPTRLPLIASGLRLPDDLTAFYERFSGARLFGDRSDPRCHILPPEEFVQMGLAVCGQETTDELQRSWYVFAHVQDGNYFAIDLAPARLGRCYDIFHETAYDSPSDCRIIALSFTELLNSVAQAGDECWWLDAGFKGYGYGNLITGHSATDC